jgi:hypothetical protein
MPFILGKKKQYFFTKIGHFLFTKRYIYFLNKFNKNFFLIKQFNIFPIRTPNLTLKILYFYFSSKKLNFIKNNILFKQYRILKNLKKNFNFLNTN